MSVRLSEFQRNAAFVGLQVLIVAAAVFLGRSFRDALIPLCWSAFFALPIVGCIQKVEEALLCAWGWLKRRGRGCGASGRSSSSSSRSSRSNGGSLWAAAAPSSSQGRLRPIPFVAYPGQNTISVSAGDDEEELLRRLNRPMGINCRCCWFLPMKRSTGWCRRRLVIKGLAPPDEEAANTRPEVNRLVDGWHYYARETCDNPRSDNFIKLELFLDSAEVYPAVMPDPEAAAAPPAVQLRGFLEVERESSVTWTLSFLFVMTTVIVLVGTWCCLLGMGIQALVDNVDAYQKGVSEIGQKLIASLQHVLPKSALKMLEDKLTATVQDALPEAISYVLSNLEIVLWDFLLFIVYLGFWVTEPLPMDKEVARVFRAYMFLKTVVCLLFGTLMAGLLWCLDCQLWPLFWIMTFLLNYIPEVGAVVSALLCVPAVLLDGQLNVQTRLWHTLWLAIFGTLFKVITGNVIEVHMYSTKGGQFMRMHPVVLMGTMMLCYSLFGISGMFLAVPIVATVKFYIVAARMPRAFLDPLLVFIEGDVTGPHRNFVDTRRSFKPPPDYWEVTPTNDQLEALQQLEQGHHRGAASPAGAAVAAAAAAAAWMSASTCTGKSSPWLSSSL